MKKLLFLIVYMLINTGVWAHDIEIDGIYYNLLDKARTAEVTYKGANYYEYWNEYGGDITIPSTISHNGVLYSVTRIGHEAFYDCGITSVTIPNSVTSIGTYAFSYTSITSITIPNSVESIAYRTFYRCSGLKNVIIPNSVTTIGEEAFYGCSSISSVSIPNSVKNIGNYAFAGCSGINSLSIPSSVNSIGNYAFEGCTNITSLNVEEDNTVYSSEDNIIYSKDKATLFYCTLTKAGEVSIPFSVTTIHEGAFKGCSEISSVNIPNSVKTISTSAFYGCSDLKKITIGENCKHVDKMAFAYCKNLEEVYCYAKDVPEASGDAFEGSYIDYCTLHVPAESTESYKATMPWCKFGTIKAIEGGDTEKKKCAVPSIAYEDGHLYFSTATPNAQVISTIKVPDMKTSYDFDVPLTGIYNITAYAAKTGYDNSDIATATLVWATSTFTPGETTVAKDITVNAKPLLVAQNGGIVTISGLQDGEKIKVYETNGTMVASTKAIGNEAFFDLTGHQGKVAILCVGEKNAKVLVK